MREKQKRQYIVIFEFLARWFEWYSFNDFKNKQKSVRSNVFLYIKVCIFIFFYIYLFYILFIVIIYLDVYFICKSVFITLYIEIKHMIKKLSSDNVNGAKIPSFFFREFKLITVLLLLCDSYMSWSTRFVSLRSVHGIFQFRFCFVLIKVYIFVQKIHGLFDFKTSKFLSK